MTSAARRAAGPPAALHQVLPGAYLSMMSQSLTLNFLGPVLPLLAIENATTPEALGLIFSLSGLGFLSGTLLANPVAKRIGLRAGSAVGVVLMGLGLLGVMVLPLPWLYAAVWLEACGCSLIEVQLNRVVEYLAGDRPGGTLNRLHSMWGIGGIIAALVTAALIAGGQPWRWIGVVTLACVLLTLALVLRWPWVDAPADAPGEPTGVGVRPTAWAVMAPFGLIYFIYVGLENSTSSWATTFFAGLGEGVVLGALATAGYFVLFTLGRWFVGPLVDRLGLMRMVRVSLAMAVIGIALTAWSPARWLGFALAGLGQSVVFPTLLVWGVRRHPMWRPELNAIALGGSGVASMTIPYLIGLGVAVLGPEALTPLLTGLTVVTLTVTFLLR